MEKDRDKILIVEPSKPVSTILTLFLQSFFENPMIFANSFEQALNVIKEEDNLGVIFVDNIISGGRGFGVYEYMTKIGKSIPFFLISSTPTDNFTEHFNGKYTSSFKVIPKPFNKSDILDCAKFFLQSSKPQFEGYRKIKAECIEFLEKGKFKFYLELSEEKLVPISFNEDNEMKDIIERYSEKGVSHFFLEEEDFQLALEKSLKLISRKLVEKDPELKDRIVFQINFVENIHSNLKDLGMKPEVIELSQKTIEMTLENLRDDSDLLILLKTLGEKESYIFELGILTASVATAIASQMTWGNSKNLEILASSAILQDISLKEPSLARISCFQDPEFAGFPKEDQEKIKNHPEKSVELISKVERLDPMVKTLILHHHELPLGDGFPKGIDANTLPEMSCVFILSHFYAQNLLKFPPSRGLLNCLNETVLDEFSSSHFKEPAEAFKKAFAIDID